MTLGEYIREAELFEYSKDYFNMVKEAGELKLMSMYIEANDYLIENGAYLDNYSSSYISEMFMEAKEVAAAKAEDNKPAGDGKPLNKTETNEVKDSFAKRAWDALKKVLTWILRPFKAIGTFLKNQWNKLKSKFAKKEVEKTADNLKKIAEDSKKNPEAVKEVVEKTVENAEKRGFFAQNTDSVKNEFTKTEETTSVAQSVKTIVSNADIDKETAEKFYMIALGAVGKLDVKMFNSKWMSDLKDLMEELGTLISKGELSSMKSMSKIVNLKDISVKSLTTIKYTKITNVKELDEYIEKLTVVGNSIAEFINTLKSSYPSKENLNNAEKAVAAIVETLTEVANVIQKEMSELMKTVDFRLNQAREIITAQQELDEYVKENLAKAESRF